MKQRIMSQLGATTGGASGALRTEDTSGALEIGDTAADEAAAPRFFFDRLLRDFLAKSFFIAQGLYYSILGNSTCCRFRVMYNMCNF
ncbi:MAG: hypothetical protein A2Y62_08085 [Candidatus Fischerbacteria bacterium RBG_13_37_8]|uniref:Uncharacterized protein n=1 Tax=Candidatus Fischerbacteria bacterium RBG_13_37_8 TaxID=1817863 RepID=A0A1F5VVF3_9BACT|nr:MAG: hypothetical protein A2Y62_08085 [Candidatus Fischerbacteria bacterium RBG_13_37_8]